ncbi:MAG: choice-of-anchor V domain-containing protein [Bacteroidota bacterium]
MKHKYFLIFLSVSVMGGLAFTKMSKHVEISKFASNKSHINESGAPAGKTGAPGENSCTECHSGSVQSGTNFNNVMLFDEDNILVTEYTPGSTYNVLVTVNSTAAKKGFEATARVSSNNTTAGTMASVAGSTQIRTGSGSKKFATHINSSTGAQSGWAFTWTAPATDVGNVIFYVATNVTNNNESSSGDVIRTSQHAYSAVDNAGIKEAAKAPFSAVFHAGKQAIQLSLEAKQGSVYSLNIVDMTGKSVLFKRFSGLEGDSKEEIFLPESVKEGMYVLHFFEDNNSFAQKIYISK